MRHFAYRVFALALAWACAVPALYGQGTTITLLHVNDTHSHLDAVGPRNGELEGTLGGISRAAAVIGAVRMTEPNVLLLHAGDIFQGDLFFNAYFGVPELRLMREMGFDAMAVGNHEFDLGPGLLADAVGTAFADGSFPLVSANLDLSAFPALQPWILPSIVRTYGEVKVAVFGLTLPYTPTNMPDPVVIDGDVVGIAQATADALRADGADVVVLLSHLGIYYDRIVGASATGIDVIVGGHDHYLFREPETAVNPLGEAVPILQAGEHYKHVGRLTFTVDAGDVTIGDYAILDVDASVPAVPEIQAVVEDLKAGIESQFGPMYHEVIGRAPAEVTKRYDPRLPLRDTPIGNLVTDAFRAKTGTDLGITALGLISEKIEKGPILGADLFRVLSYGYDVPTGFGFRMATFDVTGTELVKGMEIGLSQLEVSDDLFLQYSGLRFTYDPLRPAGERVDLASIRINGKKWSPAASYSVTVNTGIAMLLGMIGVNVDNLQLLDDLEYDVVRDYIASLGAVAVNSQGRIREHAGKGGAVTASVSARASAWPNPFNPSTTVTVTLDLPGRLTATVYDAIGREVVRLADAEYAAGVHEIPWDAGSMPTGVYFCRISAPSLDRTVRLLLLR